MMPRGLGDGLTCRALSDELGVAHVQVLLQGLVVASLRCTMGPQLLVIVEFVPSLGAPPVLERRVLGGLLRSSFGGEPPPVFCHLSVLSERTLAWFHAAPWSAGVLVSGLVGGLQLDRHPLRMLAPQQLGIATGQAVAVTYERALIDQVALLREGQLCDVVAGWRVGSVQYRETLMHRALLDGSVPSDLCDTIHMIGLADVDGPVRHTAAGYLRGAESATQEWTPDLPQFFEFLSRPLVQLRRRGADVRGSDEGFDPARCRRSARLAVFFAIGNPLLAMRAPMERHIERRLRADRGEWSDDRDRWLYELAVGSLDEVQPGVGVGVDAHVGLLDLARFCVHRHRLLCRLEIMRYDKHYWLMMAVDALCRSPRSPLRMTGPDQGELAQVLYGPSPTIPMPRRTSSPDQRDFRVNLQAWPLDCE